MIRLLLRLLAASLVLLVSPAVHAAITCSIGSSGFATAYDPASALNNVTQSFFTVTCTRALSSDPSSVNYAVTVDNGMYANGINNRAAYLANRIRYDVFKDSSCATKWKGSTSIAGTINFASTGTVSQQANFWGCVLPAQTGLAAGTYTDIVTATLTYGPTPSLVALGTFNVSITTPATCSLSQAPGNVVFNYTAFGAAVNASTTFGVTCTNSLPYSMALDLTAGTIVGINYSIGLSAASSVGTGAQQNFTVDGTIAAGQAGTCAASGCSGSNTHSITITY